MAQLLQALTVLARSPQFGSQTLHGGSQSIHTFFWSLWPTGMHTAHIHTRRQNTLTHTIKFPLFPA